MKFRDNYLGCKLTSLPAGEMGDKSWKELRGLSPVLDYTPGQVSSIHCGKEFRAPLRPWCMVVSTGI
jgi:hypothetical protein